ncbi:uncharacterized protein DFL_000291 [Arthrobotrys flagrans]|uniref:Uncharacterized protein n=1 Tax=Arthrobotrys flagrans TaxID=97331 RepID=A0A437ADA1_ARTFL|nr:hypothetical protein DFL_000291 [Arthrobotrys flagrans]
MQAIVQLKNEKIVSGLIDEGADLEARNGDRKTAQELAAAQFNSRLLYALLPADQRANKRASILQNFRAFIGHIIWVVNTAAGKGVGYMKTVFGMTGRRATDDPLLNSLVPKELRVKSIEELNGSNGEVPKSLEDRMTLEEFETNVLDIVDTMGLNRFFPKDSDKLRRLAQGLVNFKKTESNLNTVENLCGLATLSLYKTIILCDASGSICATTTANSPITRIKSQNGIIGRIAEMTSILMPNDGGIYMDSSISWISFVISRIGDDKSADKFITQLRDLNELGDNAYVYRDQIDEGIGGGGLTDAALEMRFFDILTTPLLK